MVQQKRFDINGKAIQFLLIVFIWYSEVIQQRFSEIPGAIPLLCVSTLAIVLLDLSAARNREALQRVPKAAWLMFMYILLTFVVGFFVAPNIELHTNHGITTMALGLIMLTVCYYAVSRNTLNFLFWNIFIMCLCVCFMFLVSPVVYYDGEQIRYSISEKMNPNGLAMQFAAGIWMALYLISKKKLNALLGVVASALFVYGIVLTGSRKGLVGAGICILGWIIFYYFPSGREKDATNRLLRGLLFFAVAVALIVVLAPRFISSDIAARFEELFKEGGGTRTDMYKVGLQYLKKSPWFGLGYWGFGYYYGYYSHATWIEVPVNSGIPLALLYFSSYVSIFLCIGKQFKQNKIQKALSRQFVDVRLALVLMLMLMFYTVCVIHIYDTMSFIYFSIIMASYSMDTCDQKEVAL